MSVVGASEIKLNGYKYQLAANTQVAPFIASRWPEKIVTGDYTKDSDPLRSSHTWSDFRGGIGVKHMKEGKDDDRCYWSTCNIDYVNNLVLRPLKTVTYPAYVVLTNPNTLMTVGNLLWSNFGGFGCIYYDGNSSWYSYIQFTSGRNTVTDSLLFGDFMFFASINGLYRYWAYDIDDIVHGWFTGGGSYKNDYPMTYLLGWDDKLWGIDYTGQLRYSLDYGNTFIDDAKLELPDESVTGLIEWKDKDDNRIIYVGTKYGLYAHDADNQRFHKTGLSFPYHPYGCAGMAEHRHALYVSLGMDVFELSFQYGSMIVKPIGLKYNMSIPTNYVGNIRSLASSYNHLYAAIDATSLETQDLFAGTPFKTDVILDRTGYSFIGKWNGYGWTVLDISASTEKAALLLKACWDSGKYRLWFRMNDRMNYVRLENELMNPIEVGSYYFAASGEHITPYFDADNDTTIKTAIRAVAYTSGCSANETVVISYQINNATDAAAWTSLAAITTNGETSTSFTSGAGIEFYNIRFKIALARGSTTTNTPNLHFLKLEYVKIPNVKYGYQLRIDMDKATDNYSADTRMVNILTAASTKTLIQFSYNDTTTTTPKRVMIDSFQAHEETGKYPGALYDIVLKEV